MIPSARRAPCEFCSRDIDITADGTHQYTTGWVKVRSGGGGHAIALPDRENRWACDYCIRRKAGGYDKQGSML
jgi:hypothetical protein